MEPVHFGSKAWKNHPDYDDRYPDNHVYNRKAYDSQFTNSSRKKKKKKTQTIFNDDDFGPY